MVIEVFILVLKQIFLLKILGFRLKKCILFIYSTDKIVFYDQILAGKMLITHSKIARLISWLQE